MESELNFDEFMQINIQIKKSKTVDSEGKYGGKVRSNILKKRNIHYFKNSEGKLR